MNAFVIAAIAMLLGGMIPCGIVMFRGLVMESVVAFEAISAIAVMVLILLAEGFRRSGEFELPLILAVMMFGSCLVFVKFVGRDL